MCVMLMVAVVNLLEKRLIIMSFVRILYYICGDEYR